MKLLLDTHVFLWIATDDDRLPRDLKTILRAPSNEVYLSVASSWEIAVKAQSGKLVLPMPVWAFILESRERLGIQTLSIQETAVAHVAKLPDIHRDPFDRMLVCQAIQHELTIVTSDTHVQRYPVKTMWA
ncbi:MAG: type II toxin-antitoxin system VapC family toxin [Vicinamibacterales bacterium]